LGYRSDALNIVLITKFSFPATINVVLLIVRLFLGPMIFTHGYRKFFRGGRLAGTAGWFEKIGKKPGRLNAVAAASTETGVGVLLTVGLLTPLASAGLLALMTVAIVSVHRKNGFMISNKGEGMEYCLALSVMALALGTLGPGKFSLDFSMKIFSQWSFSTDFFVTLAVGLGAALLQLLACYRPPKPS
jgi:putative oxidoreductase